MGILVEVVIFLLHHDMLDWSEGQITYLLVYRLLNCKDP